jgi:hypothetical protein
MKQSDVRSIDSRGENSTGASNKDLSEASSSGDEPRAASGNIGAGEGSIGYRIAALIAMLLLAVIALANWVYLRVT